MRSLAAYGKRASGPVRQTGFRPIEISVAAVYDRRIGQRPVFPTMQALKRVWKVALGQDLARRGGPVVMIATCWRFDFVMKLIIGLFALAFLAACETTTITPTASMKPALAERLAVLNTDEPMPPAEGPEDVAPGPARDPTRNPGLVPSPLLRYSAASMTP
jgi:hypothetical protein